MPCVRVSPDPFDADARLADFACGRAGAGALASFVGYCRGDADGVRVARVELEHYSGFTETEIERLVQDVANRQNLIDVLVIHRSGAIAPGEPIVLVAALARHRSAAFSAVEELMDYLKTDAPFWKREITEDGARWIEPTQADRRRRARWSNQ